MSRKICVQFEVRDMLIMKDTLNQMGINFSEVNQDVIEIRRGYPITIDAKTGEIKYDSDQTGEVDKIKQNYMVNFYKDQAIREGMKVDQKTMANGDIEIYLS